MLIGAVRNQGHNILYQRSGSFSLAILLSGRWRFDTSNQPRSIYGLPLGKELILLRSECYRDPSTSVGFRLELLFNLTFRQDPFGAVTWRFSKQCHVQITLKLLVSWLFLCNM